MKVIIFVINTVFLIAVVKYSHILAQGKPNIIIILADDLGTGDLSFYNKESKIQTPHIDQLAGQGVRFTNAHSSSAVCTPTRYSLLTGRYGWRTELKKGVLWPWDPPLIGSERLTLPEMLQEQEYFTVAIGKWHLGWNWPIQDNKQIDNIGKNVDYRKQIKGGPLAHGFDYYFGDDVPNFPPYTFIQNRRVTKIPTVPKPDSVFGHAGLMAEGWELDQVMPKITSKSVAMIDSIGKSESRTPFFLYFALTAPHTPIAPLNRFQGESNAGDYGDYVTEVDWSVGQIMEALKRNNLNENTLVIFTSDNGSPARDGMNMAGPTNSVAKNYNHDPSNGLRGIKSDIWEGGHRVPYIARWPEKVIPGTKSTEVISLVDMMTTIADITGYKLPDNTGEDSYSFLPIVLQKNYSKPLREATVFHSIDGRFAIRKGPWKLILWPGSGGWSSPRTKEELQGLPAFQLYNLEEDPSEERNVVDQYPEKVKELKILMKSYIAEGRSTPGSPQQNEGPQRWSQLDWMD